MRKLKINIGEVTKVSINHYDVGVLTLFREGLQPPHYGYFSVPDVLNIEYISDISTCGEDLGELIDKMGARYEKNR